MYLLVDNSVSGKVQLILAMNNKVVQRQYGLNTESLLSTIDNFLRAQKISPARISGLAVRIGVGGFTATRVAVTVVNTLAYAWQAKAIPWREGESVAAVIKRFANARPRRYVSATYSGEAHIGKPVPARSK